MNKYIIDEKTRIRLGNYVKEQREKKGYGLNQLAVKINVTNSLISKLENGITQKISPFLLRAIADGLKIDYKELYKIVGYIDEEETTDISEEKGNVKILDTSVMDLPVYGKASAGNGYLNLDNVMYHKKVICNGFSKDSFLVEICGNSMEPKVREGDWVLVDPQESDYIPGKVYVVTYEEETYIKQIDQPNNDMVVLKSYNSDYTDIYIIGERMADLKVEGRVIKVIREEML